MVHNYLTSHMQGKVSVCVHILVCSDQYIFVLEEGKCIKQESTHTGADSSSVNNIPLLSDYQHCNIICYCKEHNGQKYALKK